MQIGLPDHPSPRPGQSLSLLQANHGKSNFSSQGILLLRGNPTTYINFDDYCSYQGFVLQHGLHLFYHWLPLCKNEETSKGKTGKALLLTIHHGSRIENFQWLRHSSDRSFKEKPLLDPDNPDAGDIREGGKKPKRETNISAMQRYPQ